MNISGIRPYGGFYEYNQIKSEGLRQQTESIPKENAGKQEEPSVNSTPVSNARQDMTSLEYAKQYQPDAVYDLKGADSDIAGLDTQQLISDLDKDQILRQYQYFVGSRLPDEVTELAKDPVGQLRSGENFSL